MGAIAELVAAVRRTLQELVELAGAALSGGPALELTRADRAQAFVVMLAGLVAVSLLARTLLGRRRRRIAVPALLPGLAMARGTILRHGARIVAVVGVAFFVLAFAEPRTAFTRQDTTYPGRRIAILLDASSSMLQSLPGSRLAKGAPNDAAFFTTVGAARYFVELRMKASYRDLVSLIEFGDEAYVITPFTSDYENILLSMSLIGDWTEFMNFPEQGTVIAKAIDQGVGLFQAFDFLDAAGNIMVIFSDGMDAEVLQDGRTTLDVLREARRAEIPVYFIRTGRSDTPQGTVPDAVWESAVARTGGRFYSAADEATIVRAIHEIDRQAAGRIEMRRYSTQIPRYGPFAFAAVALWTLALTLRLATPWFTRFP
ncbi:MAG: vWA domain-containing protein [Vicinamibacterales bacterium]